MFDSTNVKFGRIEAIDPRDSNYPISRWLSQQNNFTTDKMWWEEGWWGNQGQTDMCVAFSWSRWLEDGPVIETTLDGGNIPKPIYDPAVLYNKCQMIDGLPMPHSGSTVRAAAKVLTELGWLKEYRWAQNINDVVSALLVLGPFVVGTTWYNNMFYPDGNYVVHPGGGVRGGHAYVLNGIDTKSGLIRIKNSWGHCFDKETEVLTNNGWKLFKDLLKNDLIATLNHESHELEYQNIIEYHEYDYDGDLYNYKSSSVDLSVTPNHKLYIRDRSAKTWKLEEAQNIKIKHFGMKKDAKWVGKDVEFYKIGDHLIPMETWLEFLGYFISHGYVVENSLSIRMEQLRPENIEKINSCIDKLPFVFSTSDNKKTWEYYDNELHNELNKLGKSCDRHIPSYIKELSRPLLHIFFDALMINGGHNKKSYYTSSKLLADDFQELLLKVGFAGDIGYAPIIKIIDKVGKNNTGKNNQHTEYRINIKVSSTTPDPGTGFMPKLSYYNDKVYCVTVPNHIIYVRRNGKSVWSGNSWGDNGNAYISISDFGSLLTNGGEACMGYKLQLTSVPDIKTFTPVA